MSKVTDNYYKEMIEVAKLEQKANLISGLDQGDHLQFKNLFAEIKSKLLEINELNILYIASKEAHRSANQFIVDSIQRLTFPKVKPLFKFFVTGHKDLQLYRNDIYKLFDQIKELKKEINYLINEHQNSGLRLKR